MYAINEHIQSFQYAAFNQATVTRNIPWFKAPRALNIKAGYATTESGMATANSTQSLSLALLNGGTVGTATATIGTFGTVATPYTWTARQGYQATFDTSSNKDLAEGAWLVAQINEVGGTSTTPSVQGVLTVCVHHVEGTGRVQ